MKSQHKTECGVSRDKLAAPALSLEDRGSGTLQTRVPLLLLSDLPCLTATPPPPILYFMGNYPTVQRQSTQEILACKAPRNAAEFQLRRGEKVLNVHGVSPLRDLRLYYLNLTELEDQGPFTCRYRLHRKLDPWSEDSKPIELMWTDGESCSLN